jgi:hypothetical protein
VCTCVRVYVCTCSGICHVIYTSHMHAGVAGLIAECEKGTTTSQEHACATLRNIGRTNRGRMALAEGGALPCLVAALGSSHAKHREVSASALANVALLARYQVKVAQEGAIKPLVGMIASTGSTQWEARQPPLPQPPSHQTETPLLRISLVRTLALYLACPWWMCCAVC